jgi:integrase
MTKYNEENERLKRAFFHHLAAARGLSEASIGVVASAIDRFEQSTGFRSFKRFHIEQAIAFRRKMDEATNARDGKPLSKSTILQTLNALRGFFLWLAGQPGYRSRIRYSDADFFRLSEKDTRIAKASHKRPVPTPEQIENCLGRMPTVTVLERRNRAMLAFTWLTGVRDGALVSLKVKHVNLADGSVDQDAREVNTKNSKSQLTTFFGVGGSARGIVEDWIFELVTVHLWGRDDPLFPPTLMQQGPDRQFQASGIARKQWRSADAARKIFRDAFESIGLHGFNPHSFRHALAVYGETHCRTPEEFKAWSQNLGHEDVLTTFSSYGSVPPHRQSEIIKSLANRPSGPSSDTEALASRVAQLIHEKIAASPT